MPNSNNKNIKIGVSDFHGAYEEQALNAPASLEYVELKRTRNGSRILQSPIKGYFSKFDETDCDIIESVISPIYTNKPWVYSIACFQEALAFSFLGAPSPKFSRLLLMQYLFQRDNCKKIVFWSEAGKKTLASYGGITSGKVHEKSTVVYPAVRVSRLPRVKKSDSQTTFFFSGDFFRKGGVNVVDSFELLAQKHKNIKLIICSDVNIDFNTQNTKLKQTYLDKITHNPNIEFVGRVKRDVLINSILPKVDVLLLPTYNEAFGFAALEAMAFGIPVVATNPMALPEIISHENSGFLIDISEYDLEKMFKGYRVDCIPPDFNTSVTQQLIKYMETLISNPGLRRSMSEVSINIANEKFSFEQRNTKMREIYSQIID
ncbi:glycosyltransferase family 4 protein [Paraglaciecola sp.]|uniref:glycosyltransferase family 4 protein n=1 Tax=Paraglaciecola sp. TaxID=1920173 RepID=UPI00273FC79F|nr:glycosyltransferase family 4 protein [Paraglaciecola sp.]MDP5032326.1 glycosyltransferase family 4 protein [Paraglaciecola sp.]